MSASPDNPILDHAMRVLWALVERAGGSITVPATETGPVTGSFHVVWNEGEITVSIAKGHGEYKQ